MILIVPMFLLTANMSFAVLRDVQPDSIQAPTISEDSSVPGYVKETGTIVPPDVTPEPLSGRALSMFLYGIFFFIIFLSPIWLSMMLDLPIIKFYFKTTWLNSFISSLLFTLASMVIIYLFGFINNQFFDRFLPLSSSLSMTFLVIGILPLVKAFILKKRLSQTSFLKAYLYSLVVLIIVYICVSLLPTHRFTMG
jgi:hypothetical protein